MTIIAYDGKTLAADKLTVNYGSCATTTKVHRVYQDIVGLAGSAVQCAAWLAWFKDEGADPGSFPKDLAATETSVHALVIKPNGHILVYETSPYPMRIEDRYAAIGSGRDFALAAMELGHSAEAAVLVASALCSSCGRGVDTLSHRPQ